eukprot:3869574-Rhodomonas_salina.3
MSSPLAVQCHHRQIEERNTRPRPRGRAVEPVSGACGCRGAGQRGAHLRIRRPWRTRGTSCRALAKHTHHKQAERCRWEC